jgi:uncharacterized protein YggE
MRVKGWTAAGAAGAAIAVAVLTVTLLGPAATGQTTGGDAADVEGRTITVSASATIATAPDEAVVTFGVRAEHADSVAALDATSATIADVLDAMGRLGIRERDVETTRVGVAVRTLDRGTASERTVYVATSSLEVTIADLDAIGAAIRDGVAAGASSVRGVRFQVSDPEGASARALEEAVGIARRKADALAGAAGATVTGAVEIRERSGGRPRPYLAADALAYGRADAGLPVVPPRDIETEVAVTVVWSIG